MPSWIVALGRNIDWIAALVVLVAWFCSDQGWIAIGDDGSPDAFINLGGQTLAAAGALVLVLRGAVERHVRKTKAVSGVSETYRQRPWAPPPEEQP